MICTFLLICSWIIGTMSANKERTFIMIKPDGVQRGLVGEIIRRFEAKGFKLVALKMKQVCSDELLFDL
jgi:nucleoside-diphosphate kinase